jgi:hypothetical protein
LNQLINEILHGVLIVFLFVLKISQRPSSYNQLPSSPNGSNATWQCHDAAFLAFKFQRLIGISDHSRLQRFDRLGLD